MNPVAARFLVELRRVRLLAVLAGLAWTLGVTPPSIVVRILLAIVVTVALLLDAFADVATDHTVTLPTGPVRGDRT